MSQIKDYIAAIDIGTTKIVAIIGRKDNSGKIKILGFGQAPSRGVKRGVVLNIEETSLAIKNAVNIAKDMSGINFKDVFVGIAGQHVKSIKNRHSKYIQGEDNEITKADIEELTADMYQISVDAGEEIIHVIPQSYIVDKESGIRNPVGMFGKKLEANFHIVIGQIASAKNINRCAERAGLNVVKLILEPIASADAILSKDEKEAGVVLVDIGGGTTDIAIYTDNTIRHTAVIPFGGNVVTDDIREGCSILHRHAEKLKINYGSALSDLSSENKVVAVPGISGREPKEISFKTLSDIIQARMEEIIDTIDFEIQNSGHYDSIGAGIALTGGGAMLRHLSQLIKFKTGLDVKLSYPKKYIYSDIETKINKPMYSTSVGLVLKGYEYKEILREKNIEINQEIPDDDDNQTEVPDKKKKQGGLFKNFKKSISNLFDDNDDAQM